MKLSIIPLSKWVVRLTGSLSAVMLLTVKSWGDTSLVITDDFCADHGDRNRT